MSSTPAIFLGDLVRARDALQPDAEALRRMATMLSLDRLGPERQPVTDGAWANLAPSEPAGAVAPPAGESTADGATQRQPAATTPGAIRTTSLAPATAAAPAAPSWAADVSALPVPPSARAGRPAAQLLAPASERALLGALLATWVQEGPPDLRRMLRDVAQLKPLIEIPRLPVPTLRRGAQVLLDVGPAMAPYRGDGRRLVSRIATLLTADVEEFERCPGRGVGVDAADWRPPPAGTTLVIVSEFGIGGPPFDPRRTTTDEWLAFATKARLARLPRIGLVPFGPDRWPPELARAMTLVHWNRTTGVAAVRRARRPA